ncbi:hypothetical protein ACJX0J_014051, partial [Zea mays]
ERRWAVALYEFTLVMTNVMFICQFFMQIKASNGLFAYLYYFLERGLSWSYLHNKSILGHIL